MARAWPDLADRCAPQWPERAQRGGNKHGVEGFMRKKAMHNNFG